MRRVPVWPFALVALLVPVGIALAGVDDDGLVTVNVRKFQSMDGGEAVGAVKQVPMGQETTGPSVCATPAGDGGTLALPPGKECRLFCTVDSCINQGAAVTNCSANAVVAPNGMRVAARAAEAFTPPRATPTPDAGPSDAAVYYIATEVGTGCCQCLPRNPAQ